MGKFGINEDDHSRNALIFVYFMFSTLTSVGFGDYYPLSNLEKIFMVVFMLFGVNFFSQLRYHFCQIILSFQTENASEDESEMLAIFIDCLKKFNENHPINNEFIVKLQQFFEFKWNNDKNIQFFKDNGQEIFNNLSEGIKAKFFAFYLHKEFISTHIDFFRLQRNKCKYNWSDEIYSNFMMQLLTFLEPVFFDKMNVIEDVFEEANQIFFMVKGTMVVGYELDSNKYYCIKIHDKGIIGIQGVIFSQKS